MEGTWSPSAMVLMAVWGCVTAQQLGVPAISDADLAKVSECVGSDQVLKVTGGLAKWRQPCEQLWDSPVWLSRARQSAKWEEDLWKLVFRDDLIQATGTPVPCVPALSTSNAVTLNGSTSANQVAISSPRDMFLAGCALRGALYLTSTDEIHHGRINSTLNGFKITPALRDILEQNRRLCIDYSNSINLQILSFPLSNQLGRQFAFFGCILERLASACGDDKAQQIALNSTGMTGSFDSILDSILG